MSIKTVFKAIRPSFLILSPVCVFLGLSTSLTVEPSVDLFLFFLILLGATSAHISANTLNEYYDFKSGLDLKTDKTAFSGGSGALPDNPEMANTVLTVGLLSLLLTILVGVFLIIECGTHILPIGIIGVTLVITYTQWLNRFPLLCLIAPGLGFGVLMVVGTHMVLTGELSQMTLIISLIPFLLINNLLLLNQYPDIKADASVGRKTFPIAFGVNKSSFVYATFSLVAHVMILIFIFTDYLPSLSIIAFIPMVFSLFALSGAIKYGTKIGYFPQYLAANVATAILTPLLLSITIIIKL